MKTNNIFKTVMGISLVLGSASAMAQVGTALKTIGKGAGEMTKVGEEGAAAEKAGRPGVHGSGGAGKMYQKSGEGAKMDAFLGNSSGKAYSREAYCKPGADGLCGIVGSKDPNAHFLQHAQEKNAGIVPGKPSKLSLMKGNQTPPKSYSMKVDVNKDGVAEMFVDPTNGNKVFTDSGLKMANNRFAGKTGNELVKAEEEFMQDLDKANQCLGAQLGKGGAGAAHVGH